ncbi:hypothetical protein V8C42DRAFT_337846 [Trichoderma barbatum]
MNQSDNWPSDDDISDSQGCHILTSDDDDSPLTAPVPKSRLRPAGKAPAHVPPIARDLDTSDEEAPTIPYNVEWKLQRGSYCRSKQYISFCLLVLQSVLVGAISSGRQLVTESGSK